MAATGSLFDRQLIIQITLDDGNAKKVLAEFGESAERTGVKVSKAFDNTAQFEGLQKSIKELNETIKQSGKETAQTIKEQAGFSRTLKDIGSIAAVAAAGILAVSSSVVRSFAGAFIASSRNIFGLAENLIILGASSGSAALALGALGPAGAAASSFFGAISLGSAVAVSGLTFLISKFGSFLTFVGDGFVNLSKKAVEAFTAFEQSETVLINIVRNFNVVTNNAIGTTDAWTTKINELSRELGIAKSSLNAASSEIIQVASRLGLNEEQLQKLLRVSAEYAAINKKDVLQTTIALVSALNGNSQAALQYGLKLGEASNIAFAFKKGVDENFRSLTENEKVQIRFNNLLSQFQGVAGVAAATSSTLASQNERLKNNLNDLSVAYGRGAAIVENWQIANFLANKAVESVSENVIAATGFIGALGGRILQGIGIFTKYALTIFTVVRGYQILNLLLVDGLSVLLKTAAAQSLLNKNFEILGGSFASFVSQATKGNAQLTTFNGLVRGLGAVLQSRGAAIFTFITGLNVASISLKEISGALLVRVSAAFQFLASSIATVGIALAPFLLKLGLISAGLFLIVKAFQLVDQQTGIFSNLFSSLKSIFEGFLQASSGVAAVLGQVLKPIFEGFSAVLDRTIGLIALVITGIFELTTKVLLLVPGLSSLFEGLGNSNQRLALFRKNLIDTGLSASAFGKTVLASTAQVKQAIEEIDFERLADIRKRVFELEAGERGKLNKALFDDVQAIGRAAEQGLISSAEAGRQITVLSQEYWRKVEEIRVKGLQKLQSDLDGLKRELLTVGLTELQQVDQTEKARLQILNTARAQGLIDKQAFEDLFTKIQQDAALKRQEIIEKETFTWNDALKEISDSAIRFGPLISGVVQRIGAAFVQGSSAFSDFRAFIFNIFGDILIQVGFAVAGIGEAIEALKLAFASFSGGFAIGAGLALIALGGLLKASAGTLLGAAASGAAGNIGGSGNITPIPVVETLPPIEPARQGTEVNINIEGNVLDRRDTGLAIAEVLQEFFDTNNGVLVRS
jgi:hypothetical protein